MAATSVMDGSLEKAVAEGHHEDGKAERKEAAVTAKSCRGNWTDSRKKIQGRRTWENGIAGALEALGSGTALGIRIIPQPLDAQYLSGGHCRALLETLYS